MKKLSKSKVLLSCVCLLISFVMMFNLTSCGLKISAAELSEGYTRKATNEGQVTEEFKLALAEFSMSLFRGVITKDSENELVSPLSAVLCIAMLANGADGNTKKQMEDAFGMDIDTLNECLYAYTNSLYSSKDCKANIANSIWFRDNENMLQVNEAFLQTNADWYDAQVYAAPFDQSTLEDINNWCKEQTDGMIEKILEQVSPDDIMYLINALVFDAKWAEKYEKKQILDKTFTNYDGTETLVKMLSSEEHAYLSGDGVKGFAKNYSGDKYSIVGLLSDKELDIYDFVASLDGEKWMSLWKSKGSYPVHVKMPEFSYETSMDLNDPLRALGMTDMFSPAHADFSKLGSSTAGNIYCAFVKQKTFIEVNRDGTKAAAVTIGGMKPTSVPQNEYYVTLDRPFVYAIVDNATGLPLFIGAVTNLG